MHGIDSLGDYYPIRVSRRGLMATISDSKNVDKIAESVVNKDARNLKTIDYAAMPSDCNELSIRYSVTFMGNSLTSKSCSHDGQDTRQAMEAFVQTYKRKKGYVELAKRYLTSIANAQPAWRNRKLARSVTTLISVDGEIIEDFVLEQGESAKLPKNNALVKDVAKALSTQDGYLRIDVEHILDVPEGSEVYPSQCYVEGSKGRVLASRGDDREAIIHHQKVGNAIRTIDDWYPKAMYPIAVETYGIDRSMNTTVRAGKHAGNLDFFSLVRSKTLEFTEQMSKGSIPDDAHYMVAVLIRGGLFHG